MQGRRGARKPPTPGGTFAEWAAILKTTGITWPGPDSWRGSIEGVWAWLAAAPGEIIPDLGCGEGSLTAPIVETGAEVLVLNRSAWMTAATRHRCPDFIESDMVDVALPRRCEAVFRNAMPQGSTDIEAVIQRVREHLQPGCQFAWEFVVLAMRRRSRWPSRQLSNSRMGGKWLPLVLPNPEGISARVGRKQIPP
ncbi:MAG: class I SAM-dependent methyltransferase [Acidobacteriota bacterium]